MAPLAITFGVLLTLLGPALYFPDMRSPTALIPSAFGIALIVLGVLARSEKMRMHAMHGAALLGLIGFAFPAVRVIAGLRDGKEFDKPLMGQTAMSVLCLVFVVLCVRSFIAVRRARKQREAQGETER